MNLSDYLRDVPDFPKPGIVFKDISPLLANAAAFKTAVDQMVGMVQGKKIDRIAAIESRGFLFGTPLAMALGIGCTLIRKPGKLPWQTNRIEYSLEYGTDSLEIHKDGAKAGESILLVDDVLATGGTMRAACELVEGIGAEVLGCAFLLELGFLEGREKLTGKNLHVVICDD